MKTKLYAIKASNDDADESCLLDAYFDEASAVAFAQYCNEFGISQEDMTWHVRRGLDALNKISRFTADPTAQQKYKIQVVLFPVGVYATCHVMHAVSVVELEFDFEFEAVTEMAVIKAKARDRNTKTLEKL